MFYKLAFIVLFLHSSIALKCYVGTFDARKDIGKQGPEDVVECNQRCVVENGFFADTETYLCGICSKWDKIKNLGIFMDCCDTDFCPSKGPNWMKRGYEMFEKKKRGDRIDREEETRR
ncbi:unnamed protein product, partial [Mesorhabditis belari]|uniref:Uncharacterized protein n=1 Tax=Mesorhabditis belari TaxID=2138241 RepID=A0AAF3E8N9_9BILA